MQPEPRSQNRLADPIGPSDHTLGPADAPVTIVEYGDYECPDCLNAVPIMKAVRAALGDRLRFAFRHFPKNSIHPHDSAAAEAAEAAADQGKFWEMHEALFANQARLGEIDYAHLALQLGLEIYRFEAIRNAARYRGRIKDHYESGVRSGVSRTPTFFINEVKYVGKAQAAAIIDAAMTAQILTPAPPGSSHPTR